MRIFRFVLFSLCMGLLGAVVFIAGLPKPDAGNAGGSSRKSADYPMRPQIEEALDRAVHLADARNYAEALALVDNANAFSDKTKLEVLEIDQVRDFVHGRQRRP